MSFTEDYMKFPSVHPWLHWGILLMLCTFKGFDGYNAVWEVYDQCQSTKGNAFTLE